MPLDASPPIVVDLVRGTTVESEHLVHAVVVDSGGAVVRAWGDPDRSTFPRSSVKPIQALPLVESGAADAFGCSAAELALSCASHNGEPEHQEAVLAWLDRIGCSEDDLECGVQAQRGASPAGNNCSGKHAGFLTVARHLGVDTAGYIRPDHAVQQLVTAAIADTLQVDLDPTTAGIDGCGIPVFPVPLRSLAASAARYGVPPEAWTPPRRSAARRLGDAMRSHPFLVAGTDRLCTDLLRDGGGQLLVKDGAEGVQWCALPALGLGIAVKAIDGSSRASEAALAHVLAAVDPTDRSAVFESTRVVRNHVGTVVGALVVRSGQP